MKLCILLLGVFVLSGCRTTHVPPMDTKVEKKGLVSVWATKIKDKGKKYDIFLNVTNESEKPIIILLKDISCSKGNTPGIIRHTFFNTGERTIDFGAGETKFFRMVCNHQIKSEGAFKVKISKVFSDKNKDGVTPGKKLADNIVWTYIKKD